MILDTNALSARARRDESTVFSGLRSELKGVVSDQAGRP